MRHILHKIALSPYTALSPIGPHCVPMGLNPSVVSFFFCSGRRRRLPPRPLCGSDPMQPEGPLAKVISIHAPRVGSDRGHDLHKVRHRAFQSTLPVWGATLETGSSLVCDIFQSTLPVWGATVGFHADSLEECLISIHAPRVGSDGSPPIVPVKSVAFQSTLPVWGAT